MKKLLTIAAGLALLVTGVSVLFLQLPGETKAAGITYYAAATGGSSTATTCPALAPCTLQRAINLATAGDTVIAKDGTYNGQFTINGNAGSAVSKITLKAENQHLAIFQGDGVFDSSQAGFTKNGLKIERSYWIIEGFEFKDHQSAVLITAANTELHHNLIHSFSYQGIWFYADSGANNGFVHHNVITRGSCLGAEVFGVECGGVMMGQSTGGHTIQDNIIYSVTNNSFVSTVLESPPGSGNFVSGNFTPKAQAIYGQGDNDNTLVQGNLLMDAPKTMLRYFGGSITPSTTGLRSDGNVVRDNISALGQGDGLMFGENANSNQMINNLTYGTWNTGISAKGNIPGGNEFSHNTAILSDYTKIGGLFDCVDPNCTTSEASTFRDNVFYADPNYDIAAQKLLTISDPSEATSVENYNLFWSAQPTGNWVNGVTYGANDIHGTTQPTFVDTSTCNYALASGSPGYQVGSDGTSMGISWNAYLKQAWAQKMCELDQSPNKITHTTVSGTFDDFTGVSASHYYQVFVYYPSSGGYVGDQHYDVEGNTGRRIRLGYSSGADTLHLGAQDPQRWMYIGTYKTTGDTTLRITWQNSAAATQTRIRKMPTPAEAFQWITAASATPTPTPTPGTSASINAGGPQFTASDGTYTADSYFSGGSTFSNTKAIANTTDDTLYNTERYGNPFSYDVPIQNGNYTVTLKFAETFLTGPNQRIFSVSAEGATVLSNIDIYAAAGADSAYDRTFPVTVSDGTLNLTFSASVENAKVNAIKVVPASSGPIACSQYTSTSAIPTGYASPYDVVSSPSTNLMQVTCDVSSARVDLGKGDPLQYIYNQGYLFKTGGTSWTPVPYTSTEQLIAGAWYPKTATATISLTSTELANPSYSLAYICTWMGSSWKCGCRDASCTQSYWQIQSFKR